MQARRTPRTVIRSLATTLGAGPYKRGKAWRRAGTPFGGTWRGSGLGWRRAWCWAGRFREAVGAAATLPGPGAAPGTKEAHDRRCLPQIRPSRQFFCYGSAPNQETARPYQGRPPACPVSGPPGLGSCGPCCPCQGRPPTSHRQLRSKAPPGSSAVLVCLLPSKTARAPKQYVSSLGHCPVRLPGPTICRGLASAAPASLIPARVVRQAPQFVGAWSLLRCASLSYTRQARLRHLPAAWQLRQVVGWAGGSVARSSVRQSTADDPGEVTGPRQCPAKPHQGHPVCPASLKGQGGSVPHGRATVPSKPQKSPLAGLRHLRSCPGLASAAPPASLTGQPARVVARPLGRGVPALLGSLLSGLNMSRPNHQSATRVSHPTTTRRRRASCGKEHEVKPVKGFALGGCGWVPRHEDGSTHDHFMGGSSRGIMAHPKTLNPMYPPITPLKGPYYLDPRTLRVLPRP